MIREDIKQLKTGARELRKFGLLVGGVLLALGILWWARGKPQVVWFVAPGGALFVLGAVVPRVLKPVYIVWMSLAIVLGFIVSNVILTLFFLVVITPIGLVARVFGRDFLRRKLERQASSYWIPYRRDPARSKADYERQF